jgi:hypothetical protein
MIIFNTYTGHPRPPIAGFLASIQKGITLKNTTENHGNKIITKNHGNPASDLFASIRSGITLKSASSSIKSEEKGKATQQNTSMHGMLLTALASRRMSVNLETAENCMSIVSATDFDSDFDSDDD